MDRVAGVVDFHSSLRMSLDPSRQPPNPLLNLRFFRAWLRKQEGLLARLLNVTHETLLDRLAGNGTTGVFARSPSERPNLTPVPPPIIVQHGTTLHRAQAIAANGPDPHYVEPGSGGWRWDPPGFSTARMDRPFGVGTPEQYARLKAANFPNEGGPAVLEIEVPTDIIAILEADEEARDSMDSGDTLFDPRVGMTELLAAWPTITKRVIPV